MRKLFLIVLFCLPALPAAAANNNILAVGYNHACVLDNGKIHCWGREEYADTRGYESYLYKEIAVGNDYTCGLFKENEGIKCWGPNPYVKLEFKYDKLKNPRGLISVGGYACFFDDAGIYCAGDVREELKFMAKKNVQQLFSWSGSLCAVLKNTGECWGNLYPTAYPTDLKGVTEIQYGDYAPNPFMCSIRKGKLECHTNNDKTALEVPAVSNPHSLSVDGENICVMDDSGGQCWGPSGPLQFKRPQAIVAAVNGVICALDDYTGLTCNRAIFDQMPPADLFSSFNGPLLTLDNPSIFFNTIGAASSSARNYFYSAALKVIEEDISKSSVTSELAKKAAKYLVIGLLEPVVTSGDSDYYLKTAIPFYQTGLQKIAAKGTFRNINDVPKAPLSQRIALKMIQVSLATMLEFVETNDKEEIQKTIQLVGQGMVSLSPQSLQAVNVVLHQNEDIFSKLERTKVSFLVKMIQNTTAWLNLK